MTGWENRKNYQQLFIGEKKRGFSHKINERIVWFDNGQGRK